LEALLAQITDHTLSQSQEDTDLMIRRGFIPPDSIETIGNGIDTNRFSLDAPRAAVEARLGLSTSAFRIVSVGRIVEGKGFADLVNAFDLFLRANARRAKSELLIVGGNIGADINPAAKELQALLRRLGIADKVTITGLVDNVQDYLHGSDIFVSASYREGMPRAVLEAMCSGLPVVATSVRGSREIVTSGEHGYLYTARDVDACAAAIARLFDEPAERKEMGRRGRRMVLEKYSEEAYVGRQISAIARLFDH
jgi:glycosyltransferase involved in cell wall biosynthesis